MYNKKRKYEYKSKDLTDIDDNGRTDNCLKSYIIWNR